MKARKQSYWGKQKMHPHLLALHGLALMENEARERDQGKILVTS